MSPRAIDFILCPVTDLRRAADFYRDVLGLKPGVYSEAHQWAEFECGNVTLSLKGNSPPGATDADLRLAFSVADISVAYTELRARGLTPAAPQDHGVCQHLEIRDPDGHVVILHHRADGTAG
ncbi:VOC family protein [Opitutus sp. ER46]|uniref:VOC family protein n=1 Tax=Opitutus sp. ER46 TaxID=2161864 RepID=UPI000D30FD67|nr:VOC family protein [Opitutus sp. ER46]PTX94416.1 hypothetical protein DB354_11745 [Opitutus sp. ER46]